jgi:hypothetical protein
MNAVERSQIFTAFNASKRLVTAGIVDANRLNRGLGVAQRKTAPEYNTTMVSCTCFDFIHRTGPMGKPCKHIVALALKSVAS